MQKDMILPRTIEVIGVLVMVVGIVLAVVASARSELALLLIGVGAMLFIGGDLGVFYVLTGNVKQSVSSTARDLAFPVMLGLTFAAARLFVR